MFHFASCVAGSLKSYLVDFCFLSCSFRVQFDHVGLVCFIVLDREDPTRKHLSDWAGGSWVHKRPIVEDNRKQRAWSDGCVRLLPILDRRVGMSPRTFEHIATTCGLSKLKKNNIVYLTFSAPILMIGVMFEQELQGTQKPLHSSTKINYSFNTIVVRGRHSLIRFAKIVTMCDYEWCTSPYIPRYESFRCNSYFIWFIA